MKKVKKYIAFIVIILINIFSIHYYHISAITKTATLSYLEYYEYHVDLINFGPPKCLRWSFSGSNNAIGIHVYLMTLGDFALWYFEQSNGYEHNNYGYTLSNGNYYQDSGSYNFPSSDIWYVLFYVNDKDAQSASTTLVITLEYGRAPWLRTIIAIIPILVVIIFPLLFSLITVRILKRFKAQSLLPTEITTSTPSTSNTEQEQIRFIPMEPQQRIDLIVYCPKCGSINSSENTFCLYCGKKITK